jgi:hypothetical protein
MWVTLWKELAEHKRMDTRKAWRLAYDSVLTGEGRDQVVWARVKGPITATIATLTSQGWHVPFADLFTDPEGQLWSLSHPDGGPGRELQEQIQRIVEKQIWVEAAKSWQGRGLEHGPDELASLRWHKQLKNKGRYKEMCALETIMSGGGWSDARVQQFLSPAQVPVCGKCGAAATDDLHAYWTCPGLAALSQPEVASTQRLIATAVAESEALPCLWLRGIAPAVEQDPRFAPEEELDIRPHGAVPARPWPGGKYWTDGSGGDHGSIPALSRCGCGIATMTVQAEGDRQAVARSWAVHFALPGSMQSVPRSELHAILVVLQSVEIWLPVDIASDSLVNVALYRKGPRFTKNAANPDLWLQVWEAVRLRTAETTVRWIRSHTGPKEIAAGEISELDSKGNEWADRMADRAAELAKVPELYAAPTLVRQAQVLQIQQRLVAVLMTQGKRSHTKPVAVL